MITKPAEDLNGSSFAKDNIQMAKKHMKRSSTLLIIREMQIKTTVRYHLTWSMWPSSKNPQTINAGEKGTLLHCWWECKLIQPLWRTVWSLLKKLGIELLYDPAIPLLDISGENHNSKRHVYPNVHCSTIYNSQDVEAADRSNDR